MFYLLMPLTALCMSKRRGCGWDGRPASYSLLGRGDFLTKEAMRNSFQLWGLHD